MLPTWQHQTPQKKEKNFMASWDQHVLFLFGAATFFLVWPTFLPDAAYCLAW